MPKFKGRPYSARKYTKKLKHKSTLKFKKKFSKKKKIYNRKSGGSDSSNDTQTSLLQEALKQDLEISDSSSSVDLSDNNSKKRYAMNMLKKTPKKSNKKIIIPDWRADNGVRVVYGNTVKEARTNAIKGLRKKPSSKKGKKKSLKPIYKPEKSDIWDESYLRDPFNLRNHPASSYLGSKLYVDGRKKYNSDS